MIAQLLIIAAVVIVAYAAFFTIVITAIASLPPGLNGLAVPLGIAAAIVVLLGAFQLCE
jgi:hypothetical protein